MKKILSVAAALCIMFTMLPNIPVFAASSEGTVLISPEAFASGAVLTGTDGSLENNIDVSAEDSELGNAVKVSCTAAGSKPSSLGVKYDFSSDSSENILTSGDATHLCFSARADGDAARMTVELIAGGASVISNTYYLTAQWTDYYLPVKSAKNASSAYVQFSVGDRVQSVVLANVSYINYGSSESIVSGNMTLKSGAWMRESDTWKNYAISSGEFISDKIKGDIITSAVDVEANGNYLYVLVSGDKERNMQVWSIESGVPVFTGKTEILGNVRQIEMIDDNTVFVTCRGDGAYIIDVSNPSAPAVISRYDSREMATGIAVYGSWAIVTNRVYGTEIIDISDLTNPRHLMFIDTGEAQSCQVSDGYLYAGVWGEKKVRIYNLTDLSSASALVSEINLNGLGDGLFVKDGYLYAATGHSAGGSSETDPRYGMGGGMEIYDISDPANPVWCSTCKLDGRLMYRNNDMWRVELTSNGSGYYAYLVDTYHGVYVYDVSNANQPVRLAHISIGAETGERGFNTSLKASGTTVFPYDPTVYQQMAVDGIAVQNDKLYLASSSGLYSFDVEEGDTDFITEQIKPVYNPSKDINNGSRETDFYDHDDALLKAKFGSIYRYNPGTQIYAAAENNGYVYAAAGTGGIRVLNDNTHEEIQAVTEDVDICFDVKIYGNTLYAANGKNGLCTYTIGDDGKLTRTETPAYVTKRWGKLYPVKQIMLSPNANFAVLHMGDQDVDIADMRDAAAFQRWNGTSNIGENSGNIIHTSGLMYDRQISEVINNRYIAAWGFNSPVDLIDFGEDGNTPSYIKTGVDTEMGSMGSLLPYDSSTNVLVYNQGGFSTIDIVNPGGVSIIDKNYPTVKVKTKSGADIDFEGKAYKKNNLIFITNRCSGKDCRIVNISDVQNPVLLRTFSVAGGANIPYANDKNLYLPAGYQGLYIIPIEDLYTESTVTESETEFPERTYGILKDDFSAETPNWKIYDTLRNGQAASTQASNKLTGGRLVLKTGSGNSMGNTGNYCLFDKKIPLAEDHGQTEITRPGKNARLIVEYSVDFTKFNADATNAREVYMGVSNEETVKANGRNGLAAAVTYINPKARSMVGEFAAESYLEYRYTRAGKGPEITDDSNYDVTSSRIRIEIAITDENGDYFAGGPSVSVYYKSNKTDGAWTHSEAVNQNMLLSEVKYLDCLAFTTMASSSELYLDNLLVYLKQDKDLDYNKDTNTVSAVSDAEENACVVFAAYDQEKLSSIGINSLLLNPGDNTIPAPEGFDTSDADTVKIMLFKDMLTIKPLCGAEIISVN